MSCGALLACLLVLAARTAAEPPTSPDQGSWGAARLRGMNTYGAFSDDDFATLRGWGANLIRHQLVRAKVVESDGRWTFDEPTWTHLETLLDQAHRAGLRVVIDFHSHGEVFPDKLWEPSALDAWRDPERRAKLAGLWTTIATRFRDDREIIAGYEILNEPHPPRRPEGYEALNQVMRQVTTAIRAVDDWHTIVVAGPEFSRPVHLDKLEPTGDPNTVYTFHMYEPTEFTHQGIEWMHAPFGQVYPGVIPLGWDDKVPTQVDRDWLRGRLEPVVEFQRRHGVRIWVGELGVRRWCPDHSAFRWLRDVLAELEGHGWDWCYHCYRGDRYGDTQWSVEHSSDRDDTQRHETTDRLELLRSYFSRNG